MRSKQTEAAAVARCEIASVTDGLQAVLDKRLVRGIRDFVAVGAMGRRLQVAALGRGLSRQRRVRKASRGSGHKRGRTRAKHNIKRVDRLVGNKHLHAAMPKVWQHAWKQGFIHVARRPLVLLDWTGGCEGSRLWTLSAALAAPGRAIRIYEDVVPVSQLDSPAFRALFLARLQSILPPGARVVVLTDAGFRVPFLRQVQALGWDFIVRVRGQAFLTLRDGVSRPSKRLTKKATATPTSLGPVQLCKVRGFNCAQAVLYKARPKGRKAKSRKGTPLRWAHSRKYSRAAKAGWLLVTSLSDASAEEVCRLYAQRMTIEEAFRDVKSPRFGMGLAQARTRSPQRYAVLCLLGALIAHVLDRVGRHYQHTRWARSLQANTIRERNVLSAVRIGLAVFDELLDPYRGRLMADLAP